ncbi:MULTISPECIES: S-layer glycoprotein N-glycosyltransferase AglJ [unclassified Halorubrum]|uniref:S-layer glycoprotein N-glycosyltransferase AglJ n=1 Tax=unclassified Halorubrum TaxID=2642239 RepID=UPI000B98DE32|nr:MULTISPECIES: S-layer glycoprotein N-glycosyltransferase AglJ [unclassified Halorubrum]OYR40164.1 glycosyltransferase, TIGR04182 family [Halorubrum sp. Eb13]OYR49927.1 glycosyltransferase, TIGR04182 family [Halorubrum sp. Ea1]
MSDYDDVCVLLPTMDEVETVARVVEAFRDAGIGNVLVVDGGSTDGTRGAAEEAGARVVEQSGRGKGQAVREAVRDHVDAPYVVMADADATYDADDVDAMLDPLLAGEVDHVIGNRFADMRPGAMTRLNRIGNRIINLAFRAIHGEGYRDILSGYRAFTRESFLRLHLTADGFGIETEMAVECVKNQVPVAVVPITYRERPGGSATNLHPIRDGGVIFLELYRKAKTNNPLFYFGSVGAVSTAAGALMTAYVLYEWLAFRVSHEVIAIGAVGATVLGIQLLIFGVLADMILSLHREQAARFEQAMEDRGIDPRSDGDAGDRSVDEDVGGRSTEGDAGGRSVDGDAGGRSVDLDDD